MTNTFPNWTIATLCWLFVLFNIERVIPAVNIASFVYVLSTVAGLLMLGSKRWRRQPFGLTATMCVITWIVGKSLLGYTVDLYSLPLSMTEVFAVVFSSWLCLRVARTSDDFAMSTRQLLEALRACAVPELREAEPQLLEEIRRARRHERPLTFVAIKPPQVTPESIQELLRQMEHSLGREYLVGSISEILAKDTKSHDIAARVGDQILMLLPETDGEQAVAMSRRLQDTIHDNLGVAVDVQSFVFGQDELTLTGVLDRMGVNSLEATPQPPVEVYQLERSRPSLRTEPQRANSAS
jgi:GGDEF domain-containing protein